MVGKKRGTQHANLRETKAIDYVLFTCRLRVVYVFYSEIARKIGRIGHFAG